MRLVGLSQFVLRQPVCRLERFCRLHCYIWSNALAFPVSLGRRINRPGKGYCYSKVVVDVLHPRQVGTASGGFAGHGDTLDCLQLVSTNAE